MRKLLSLAFVDFKYTNIKPSVWLLIKLILSTNSYSLIILYRLTQSIDKGQTSSILSFFIKKRYQRVCSLLNVTLSPTTKIGEGICFPHSFPLVINPSTSIGMYCTIHPCVLIGRDRGKDGAPIIGDYVFIGHGTKIIGNPKIGNFSFIAPGAIITKDVPEGTLVGAGVNNVISNEGKKHVLLYLPVELQNEISNK